MIGVMIPTMSQANENKEGSESLRDLVFSLKPEQIGLTKENFKHSIWGIIMETGLSDGYYTLVSLADGTTSLYFSNGGGIIGGGEHENVREASRNFIAGAQHFYKKAVKDATHSAPNNGEVKFYFLGFNETFMYSAPENTLGDNKDDLSQLFYVAHGVITELREMQEK